MDEDDNALHRIYAEGKEWKLLMAAGLLKDMATDGPIERMPVLRRAAAMFLLKARALARAAPPRQ